MKASEKIKEMPLAKQDCYLHAVSGQMMDQSKMAEEGGRLFAALCQVVPLINSHVIVPQALRTWGNDGHAFVC